MGAVTGDGRADIVVTVSGNWPGSRVVVLTHGSSGALGTWITYPVYDSTEPVVLEDMNCDGLKDILVADYNNGLVVVPQ